MKEREWHCITLYPSMIGGEPTVDGHRITAEQMATVWWRGNFTIKEIEKSWPAMNRGAVLVACWYMARYGPRTWRKRWKEWLGIAGGELWRGNYTTCPMPPQKEKE